MLSLFHSIARCLCPGFVFLPFFHSILLSVCIFYFIWRFPFACRAIWDHTIWNWTLSVKNCSSAYIVWSAGSSGSVCVTINSNTSTKNGVTEYQTPNRQFTRLLPSPRYLICISFPPFSCIWCRFCGQFSVCFYICLHAAFGYCYCCCYCLLLLLWWRWWRWFSKDFSVHWGIMLCDPFAVEPQHFQSTLVNGAYGI